MSQTEHLNIVQILLEAGAEVDAQGGQCGNALRPASINGHEKVVQVLLDATRCWCRGQCNNAKGGWYDNTM